MVWAGDLIVLIMGLFSLAYLLVTLVKKKSGIYFQMIVGAIACHVLSSVFDMCELLTTGSLSDGFNVGYLGLLGCFLFLIGANYGCLDGILDDKSASMEESRDYAMIAPCLAIALYLLNFHADIPVGTKICYAIVWVPATINSYYCLKHILIPDMGFGFVKAVRPISAMQLYFTVSLMAHLTAWNHFRWIGILITGIGTGVASLVLAIATKRGVKKWTL